MALRAQFQMLILAVQISSTTDFNLVQVLVQYLLLQSLLKIATSSEDVRRCYVQCTRKEKIKRFLTGLFSLSHYIQFSFVTFWFC